MYLWLAGGFAVICAWYSALVGKWLVHLGIMGSGPRGSVSMKQWQFAKAYVRYKLRIYATLMVVFLVLAAIALACYIVFGRG